MKENHGFTHGYANLVSVKARGTDAGSAESEEQLITDQYKGKENLMSIYQKIIDEISKFGNDIEIAPKESSCKFAKETTIRPCTAKHKNEGGPWTKT